MAVSTTSEIRCDSCGLTQPSGKIVPPAGWIRLVVLGTTMDLYQASKEAGTDLCRGCAGANPISVLAVLRPGIEGRAILVTIGKD